MNIGILYIAIGAYKVFWDDFFTSCEKYFLPNVPKKYFIFTDQITDCKENITYYLQEDLGWPYNTLDRFSIFWKYRLDYKECDYLFFFNSNTLFLETICAQEFLPLKEENFITSLTWNVYSTKEIPYERDVRSSAFIPYDEGSLYYQGGINGGKTFEYLQLIKSCMKSVEIDKKNSVIARNNDESHLNRYLLNKRIKVLDTHYGKPEEWINPRHAKIIFRDKNKVLGCSFINKLKHRKINILNRIYNYISSLNSL